MVGRDQYGYIKGPYYMVKPGLMPPGEHNKVESKKLHKLGKFPKLRAAGRAAEKAFSKCAPLVHPLKGYRWGTGQKTCLARANVPPLAKGAGAPTAPTLGSYL